MTKKEPTEKQLAARAKFAEMARARAAARKAEKQPDEEPEEADQPNQDRLCIFCGAYTNWHRFVNQQTIAVCEEHYYSESIGKVVQKLREITNATA